jgi:hypothetical protein
MTKNRFGLSRDIPEPIKRKIRQRCGFGCVVCGSSIVDYEHVDPEYADAKEHDPTKMTLLCPMCHRMVSGKVWSKEKVIQGMLEPRCMQRDFKNPAFDFGLAPPAVIFAGNLFMNGRPVSIVNGQLIAKIMPPEAQGAPYRLHAMFFNSNGVPSLSIVDNIWSPMNLNWDLEVVGPRIIVRDKPRTISLVLKALPPKAIEIERVDMFMRGVRYTGDKDHLVIYHPVTVRLGNGSVTIMQRSIFSNNVVM